MWAVSLAGKKSRSRVVGVVENVLFVVVLTRRKPTVEDEEHEVLEVV